MSGNFNFHLVWFSLLLTPPLALSVLRLLMRCWPELRCGRFAIASFGIVAAVFIAMIGVWTAGFVLVPLSANFVLFAIAYVAYCLAAFSLWQIRPRVFRIAALCLALIPIACGYAIGTVGAFPLAIEVGDLSKEPIRTQQVSENLVCRISTFGLLGSRGGHVARLYRIWDGVPLERQIGSAFVNDRFLVGNAVIPTDPCTEVVKQYQR